MPRKSADLHGNVPHNARRVLILVDTINDLEWPHAEAMKKEAIRVAKAIRKLKDMAIENKMPVIYLNDNFGQWRSDFKTQVDHCLKEGCPGYELAALLKPVASDYFVLKPKHSGFYASPLQVLLEHMKAKELILTGFTAESCILITAVEAFIRGYKIIVPTRCIASQSKKSRDAALHLMKTSMHALLCASLERALFAPVSDQD